MAANVYAEGPAPPVAAKVYDDLGGPLHEYADGLTLDVLSELTTNPKLIAVWCANRGDYSLPPSQSSFAMHCVLNNPPLNGASDPTGGSLAFARAIEQIVGAVIAASAVLERDLLCEIRGHSESAARAQLQESDALSLTRRT